MSQIALVTGGRGFLGQHLARALSEAGWTVHITSRSASGTQAGIACHACDLADLPAADTLLGRIRPRVVFHLAGAVSASPEIELVLPTFHSHVTSTINLMTLVQKHSVDRLVVCGSMMEMLDAVPSSPYNAAKGVARLYAQMFHSLYATPVTVARTFVTFGPGQGPEKVLPYVIRTLAAGRAPELGSGAWRADWIYVSDVIDGLLRMATAPGIEGHVLDLGRGELTSLKEMVLTIAGLMNAEAKPVFGARPDRPDEPERCADVASTTARLGWTPRIATDEGLRRTIQAYRTG